MNWNLQVLGPEIALCLVGLIVLLVDMVYRRGDPGRATPYAALLGLVACLAFTGRLVAEGPQTGFYGSITSDPFAALFRIFFCVATGIVILTSMDYFERLPIGRGELYALLIFAALGMNLMAISSDLVMIYLAIESVSIAGYVLVAYLKTDRRSNEAALKYFLYGAVCSAVMLYGMTLLYGATGETGIREIAARLGEAPQPLVLLSLVLILVGFGFKISMAPFHAWAPDVYEGAPTPVTAFLSVGPKAAGFAVLLRVLMTGLPDTAAASWVPLVAALSAATMSVGNLGALRQTNIKRLLAYSSIAHAGYMLIGVVAFATEGVGLRAVLYYLLAYIIMNLGAFGVAILVGLNVGSDDISRWRGLARRAPLLSGMMAVFLLSLAGIPPTAGFFGKLFVFLAAIGSRHLWWLAVVAIANSVISLYYYAKVLREMYFGEAPTREGLVQPLAGFLAVAGCFVLTLVVGFLPGPFLNLVSSSLELLRGP
ncbi:MAG: NADH-quinone oxidoreductase subunit N [Armatimonadota bacterium]